MHLIQGCNIQSWLGRGGNYEYNQ